MTERYANGRILPSRHSQGDKLLTYSFDGGVTDGGGRFVELSRLHEAPCAIGGAYNIRCKRQRGTVIFIGYLLNVWGHFLTDGLKKLWFLQTPEGCELIKQGASVAYVTLNNEQLSSQQAELYRLAGLDSSDWLQVTEATQFDCVIVPKNSFVTFPNETRTFDSRFAQTIASIKRNALKEVGTNLKPIERIYFTRTRLAGHKDTNEREVENFFRRLGYSIISPERLSVQQQIFLWANCTYAATTEGSIAHSAMFMQPTSHLVILRKACYVNGYQQAANLLSGVKVTSLSANHSTRISKEMPWAGPFFLCITPELLQWSGVKVNLVPVWLKPAYWMYCLRATYASLRERIYLAFITSRLGRKRLQKKMGIK